MKASIKSIREDDCYEIDFLWTTSVVQLEVNRPDSLISIIFIFPSAKLTRKQLVEVTSNKEEEEE